MITQEQIQQLNKKQAAFQGTMYDAELVLQDPRYNDCLIYITPLNAKLKLLCKNPKRWKPEDQEYLDKLNKILKDCPPTFHNAYMRLQGGSDLCLFWDKIRDFPYIQEQSDSYKQVIKELDEALDDFLRPCNLKKIRPLVKLWKQQAQEEQMLTMSKNDCLRILSRNIISSKLKEHINKLIEE